MLSLWSEEEAAEFVDRYGAEWGEEVALRTYSGRLLGREPSLVLHGGGNTSVKTMWRNRLQDEIPALFVKASGVDLSAIVPEQHCALDLAYLLRLRSLPDLSDEEMSDELLTHLLLRSGLSPSIEALVHAFLPYPYVDHTHADAVLALTNRDDGEDLAARVMGDEVIVVPYVTPGFKLAKMTVEALETRPAARGMVWMHHGIITWGQSARESYETMVELVTRAEVEIAGWRKSTLSQSYPRSHSRSRSGSCSYSGLSSQDTEKAESLSPEVVEERLQEVAPVLRGLLAWPTGEQDRRYRRVVLQWLADPLVQSWLETPGACETLTTPVLTSDHLIRTKAVPLWVDGLPFGDSARVRDHLAQAVSRYCEQYTAYLTRHAAEMPEGVKPFDPCPRVVMIPGLGVACAGEDLRDAVIARDITRHTMEAKTAIAWAGAKYKGLSEDELFRMEYRTLQHAKLRRSGEKSQGDARDGRPLRGHVALVTGAAGAIGSGICLALLEAGCLVAATDLPGEALDSLVCDCGQVFPDRIMGVPLDVTDPESVRAGFASVVRAWGGVDLVIPNAGIAAVASLDDLSLERFRRLERVNVEGVLLVLAEASRLFKRQGTGGDIVLVSTKNVFAPGAQFGAYSATKAAAHQLARVASLELAAEDVRVNMVSPDAVFSCGARRSGLWQEVGPERMRARGLDEAGLEAYYQNRNLLKARVTAEHVANAVLFFATRQTPTTGVTLPVDGGLPDATPR